MRSRKAEVVLLSLELDEGKVSDRFRIVIDQVDFASHRIVDFDVRRDVRQDPRQSTSPSPSIMADVTDPQEVGSRCTADSMDRARC